MLKTCKRTITVCLVLALLVSLFGLFAVPAEAACLSAPQRPSASVHAYGCNYRVNWLGLGSFEYYRKEIKVSWIPVAGADGYEVRYVYNGSAATKKVTGTSTTIGCRDSFFFATSTLKLQVRAYQVVNGQKVYSNWSAARTILV